MALSIRDLETERLAGEVATMTGDSKTGAVRQALRAQRERLRREEPHRPAPPGAWVLVPADELGPRRGERW
jgi:antitoxin VapB